MIYSGIGSRKTPQHILGIMTGVAVELNHKGYTLRSGHADGADWAFEQGHIEGSIAKIVNSPKLLVDYSGCEVYTPWSKFKNKSSSKPSFFEISLDSLDETLLMKAEALARSIHRRWSSLSNGARLLHIRNVFQVLGKNLDKPSHFVLCWARLDAYGEPSGGTRTAIKLAERLNIPVINMFKDDWNVKLETILSMGEI